MAKLLDFIISQANRSGAIKPAPHALKALKNQVHGVPFQLLVPGMSGVMTPNNILGGIQTLLPMFGGLIQSLGQFQTILSKITGALSGNPDAIRQLAVSELTSALGNSGALGSALLQYAPGADIAALQAAIRTQIGGTSGDSPSTSQSPSNGPMQDAGTTVSPTTGVA